MFSDCAKTFKSASAELKKMYKTVDWRKIMDEGAKKGIEWCFNVEKAPWANGLCERLVQSVKRPMRKLLGKAVVTFAELDVLLKEVEATINNRPLNANASPDPNELAPITPAELCLGRRLEPLPDGLTLAQATTDPQKRWRRRRNLLNGYWRRWRQDYLLDLQPRQKWLKANPNLLVDQIVVIRDDNVSRGEWRLARVKEVHKGKDDLVRSATLQTTKGIVRRPIQRLALLETNVY